MELYENIYDKEFSFGKNWKDFLQKLDDTKIQTAKEYLVNFIGGIEKIQGKRVIDFGSGSGIMSLCFVLLGAQVVSVDVDDNSLECTRFLQKKHGIPENQWQIKKGSVLDTDFIKTLGKYDIVYSWGVIHHSGDMWKGLENITLLSAKDSLLYVAIYNHSTRMLEGTSQFWVKFKKFYSHHKIWRPVLKAIYTTYYIFGLAAFGKNPFRYIKEYQKTSFRGMDFFTDIEDWLGGYPYEYASYREIIDFYEQHSYAFVKGLEVRSIGCNEFLFSK